MTQPYYKDTAETENWQHRHLPNFVSNSYTAVMRDNAKKSSPNKISLTAHLALIK